MSATPHPAPIVVARDLVKTYGAFRAVDGVSFEVSEGEIFGFLGPNGAGKSSTMRMLYGASPISAGSLRVAGFDVARDLRRVKALVGVVPQENNLDTDLSVLKNLLVYARYFDIPGAEARRRAAEVLDLFQLAEKANSRVDALSGGMKRRLIIGRALINQPRLVILDEPTTGLDPQARLLVWQTLRRLNGAGVTFIMTTHYMEEAAQLCQRIVVMDRGRILAEGSPAELVLQEVGAAAVELRIQPERAAELLRAVEGRDLRPAQLQDTLYLFGPDEPTLRRTVAALDAGGAVRGTLYRPATLEDVFLTLTGHTLEE